MSNQFVVMGVSGCGKSSVAMMLAQRTGGVFLDADDFHPVENKEKMRAGIPLTDENRWGWLDTLNGELKNRQFGESLFLACSALRQAYRDRLSEGLPDLRFIYLKGTKELIQNRLSKRYGHFMSPALLDSQFETLEEPESGITVPIEESLSTIVDAILERVPRKS